MDFDDVLSPVVKRISIRMLLAMVARFNLELEHMDVKTDFLYGDLKEKILMKRSKGYKEKCKEHHVCKMNRLIYGLK